MLPIELRPRSPDAGPAGDLRGRADDVHRGNSLSLRGISLRLGRTQALDGIHLEVPAGSFVAVVGPSGCGKSTLLRLIAGLEEADAGEVVIDGAPANDVPPRDRDLAMVFQGYALYPHLTVYRNLALPLEVRKVEREVVEQRVARVAEMLDIGYLLNRRPGLLSGGQRQRVALGRALVRYAPLYLLDEPLSNLAAGERLYFRREIAYLHRMLGATFVYATHDLGEAMAMADPIAVMRDGRIEQVAAPDVLVRSPASAFVAEFIAAATPSLSITMDAARAGLQAAGRETMR